MSKQACVRLTLAALFTSAVTAAHAENSVTISGNYYKERSTRIYEPFVRVTADLPYETEVDVAYLVDNITSASAAFTSTDEPFSEFRHEIRLGAKKKFFDMLIPGVTFRYSKEPDYESYTVGGSLAVNLFDENTTVAAYVQRQSDEVRQRGREGFVESLDNTFFGLSVTQVLLKNLIGGVSFDNSAPRGYQENPYRAELHPRERDRYSVAAWLGFRNIPTGTSVKGWYRLYTDSWDINAHSFQIETSQRIVRGLEINPRFRYHTQGDAFFCAPVSMRAPGRDPNANTQDPKLCAFNSFTVGAQVAWTQSWLRGTPLELFATSRIEPAYYFFRQTNRYGDAHIAQLDWYWPF